MSPSRLFEVSDLPFEFCHLIPVRLALGHADACGIAEVGTAHECPKLSLPKPELFLSVVKTGQLIPSEKARKLACDEC